MKKKKSNKTQIDYNNIGKKFIEYYYNYIENKNIEILKLFKSYSIMKFCGDEFKSNNIITKYSQIFKNNIKHTIQNIHALPDGSRRINIIVTGYIIINGGNKKYFTQYFHLCSLGDGSYWIKDTIFSFI